MSGPIKAMPVGETDLASLPSLQQYQKICSEKVPGFDLSKAQIAVPTRGMIGDEGQLFLLYDDDQHNKFCSAQIDLPGREILIQSGSHQEKKIHGRWALAMSDACAMTKKLVGEEEFARQSCQEGAPKSLIAGAEKFKSVEYFREQCSKLFDEHIQKRGEPPALGGFNLSRTRLVNPSVGDGEYSLLYQSLGDDFFCRADIDTDIHALAISHGSPRHRENAIQDPQLVIRMTDACGLATFLVGPKEAGKDCKDATAFEQTATSALENGARIFFAALGIVSVYKLGRKKIFNPLWKKMGPRLAPLAHQGAAYATRLAAQGKALAARSGTYALKTLSTAGHSFVSKMLPLGLKTFTTEEVAISAGATAGWLALAFGVGVGIGVGINYLPKLWGGREVGDHLADGIEHFVGKPSSTTIDVLDHIGFGGWNVFKHSWGID